MEALGHSSVAGLPRRNVEQQEHTLDEVRSAMHRMAATAA